MQFRVRDGSRFTAEQTMQAKRWLKILGPFLSLHAAAQFLSVFAGLIVVRKLPVAEFAIYTIATAIQAMFSVLTDAGVSTVLVARAGTLHSNRSRLAELFASARFVRRRLEIVCMLGLPIALWFWLRTKDLGPSTIVVIGLLLAVTLHFQISASIYGAVPLILLEVGRTQQAQLFGAGTRLALVYGAVALSPSVVPVIGANCIATVVQAALSRYFAGRRIDLRAQAAAEDLRAIGSLVKSQIVNSVYFAFSSQVTVWLIGLTGSKGSIAAVGALGRLSSLIAVGQTILSMLVVPRLARLGDFASFGRRAAQLLGVTLLGCALIALASALRPSTFLWLLGSHYSNLGPELPLAIGSALTFVVSATIQAVNNSKAWIERAWVAAPVMIVVQIIAILKFDVTTPRGAILVGWMSLLPGLAVNLMISFTKLSAWRRSAFSGKTVERP
jgi:hypothetical protein